VDPDWEQIYVSRYPRLVALVAMVTGSLPDAEEAVQEAFVRALGRSGRGVDDPEAWLYRVAVNHVRSRWRRLAVARRHAAQDEPATTAADLDDRLELMAALQRLPRAQREALALHYVADLSVADIARRLDVPAGTVKARLSRGREALRAQLEWKPSDLEGSTHA
jgi:RNA polymerase sigma-70 factor (ECF subfamily)